ncbi:MAG: hypothetical protein LUF27_02625 [Lachnospiraceae bacterium]|nr:hypothetical protein [Lachnospiraceae bacterium]
MDNPISIGMVKADIVTARNALNRHDIDHLCALATSLGVTIPREIRANARMYSEWEASGRYDLHFVARKDSINKALRLAEEFLQEIQGKETP